MEARNDFLERIDNISVYKKGGCVSPHKPLYLLYCISSAQHKRHRLQDFSQVDKILQKAISIISPETTNFSTQYPFWRLQNDKLAVVEWEGKLMIRKSNTDPTRTSLFETNARGGLLKEDYDLLVKNPKLQASAIARILNLYFPINLHQKITNLFELTYDTC